MVRPARRPRRDRLDRHDAGGRADLAAHLRGRPAGMKLGKRRKDDDPAAEPQAGADPVVPRERVTETWAAPVSGVTSAASYGAGEAVAIEPAVDSEAVELVGDAAPAP